MQDLYVNGEQVPDGIGVQIISTINRPTAGYWTRRTADQIGLGHHWERIARLDSGSRVERIGHLMYIEESYALLLAAA